MQIKIEIDVKPEELRRFLGLPDISGLQDDVIAFLRDKVEAAGEFHPTEFVKSNFDALRKTSAWKNLAARVRLTGDDDETEAAPAASEKPKARAPRKRAAAKKVKTAAAAEASDETPPISQIGGG